MSMELLYTSAPKGLKPGSRGFCTVAMTQGMPPQLVERLESLSGYRQVFAPQDPQAALNPVVYSHLRISVAGRSYHVLLRICAAGLDYSQRNNKFAHHLVLDPRDLSPAGPAWTLAQPGVMETGWDGTPRLLAAGRRLPSGNAASAVCSAWQQLTGDAGWGGVLTEAVIERPKTPVTIIFRPGIDPLPLIAESLALLPPDLRWNVTFSTYFTKLPPGVDCHWRCAVEGSAEAKAAQGMIIDLCRPLAAAQGGAYVTAARTGQMPAPPRPAPATAALARAVRPDDQELERLLQPQHSAEPATRVQGATMCAVESAPLDPLPPTLRVGAVSANHKTVQALSPEPRAKQSARWPIFAAATAAAIILSGGGIGLWMANNGESKVARLEPPAPQPKVPDRSSSTTTTGTATSVIEPKPSSNRKQPTQSDDSTSLRENSIAPKNQPNKTQDSDRHENDGKKAQDNHAAKRSQTNGEKPVDEKKPKTTSTSATEETPAPQTDSTGGRASGNPKAKSGGPADRHESDAFITAPEKAISLGEYKASVLAGQSKDVPICVVRHPEECQLELEDGNALGGGLVFNLVQAGIDVPSGGSRWSCMMHQDVPGTLDVSIATFDVLQDGRIRFRWSPGSGTADANMLRNCSLTIQAGKRDTATVAAASRRLSSQLAFRSRFLRQAVCRPNSI